MNGNFTDVVNSFASTFGWTPIALLPLFLVVILLYAFVRGSYPSKDFDEDDVKGLPKSSIFGVNKSAQTSENMHTKTTDHLKGKTHD